MKKTFKKLVSIKTKYGSHDCIFEHDDEKGGFVVEGKELPGIVTWGKNMIEAKKMAREAVELCVECLVEECMNKEKIRVKTHA